MTARQAMWGAIVSPSLLSVSQLPAAMVGPVRMVLRGFAVFARPDMRVTPVNGE